MKKNISLLWPQNCKKNVFDIEKQTLLDLDLNSTMKMFSSRRIVQNSVLNIISKLPLEEVVIRHRQNVLSDLVENRNLLNVFKEIQPFIDNVSTNNKRNRLNEHLLGIC